MTYEDELRQGIEAATAAGDTQGVKVLERELHRVSLKQARQADTSSPVMQGVKNWGAGLAEGALALPDLVQMGTELMVPDKLKIGPKDLHSKGMGRYLTENVMGMAPDRSSTAFEAGNITGGSVLGLPGSGLLTHTGGPIAKTVKSLVSSGIRAAKDTGVGFVGAKAGDIGQYIGDKFGQGEKGEGIGEAVGSIAPGLASAGVRKAGYAVGRGFLSDQDSKARLAAIDMVNETLPEGDKIPLSVGLIGNQPARYMENFSGILPVIGTKIHDTQRKQLEGWSKGLDQLSSDLKGTLPMTSPLPRTWSADIQSNNPDFPPTRQYFRDPRWNDPAFAERMTAADPDLSGRTPNDLGAQMGDMAHAAFVRGKGDLASGENMLTRAIGSNTEIPTSNVDPVIDRIYRDAAKEQIPLEDERAWLTRLRSQTDEGARLRDLLDQATQTGNPTLITQAQDALDAYMAQGNIRYPQLRHFRTEVGRDTTIPTLRGEQQKPIYEALTNSLRSVAEQRGVGPQWDDVMNLGAKWYQKHGNLLSDTSRLDATNYLPGGFDPMDMAHGPRKQELKTLLEKPTNTDRFNWLHEAKGQIPPEKFEYLARASGGGDTPKFRQFAGDYVGQMGVPSAGSTKARPRDVSLPQYDLAALEAQEAANPGSVDPITMELARGGASAVMPEGVSDPVRYATQSRNLNDMSKQILANNVERSGDRFQVRQDHMNTPMYNRLNAMETSAMALKERGGAGNPSGTTIMAIPAHTLNSLTNHPKGLVSGVASAFRPVVGGLMLRDRMLDETFARSLAGGPLPNALTLSDWLSFGGRGLATTDNALRGDY